MPLLFTGSLVSRKEKNCCHKTRQNNDWGSCMEKEIENKNWNNLSADFLAVSYLRWSALSHYWFKALRYLKIFQKHWKHKFFRVKSAWNFHSPQEFWWTLLLCILSKSAPQLQIFLSKKHKTIQLTKLHEYWNTFDWKWARESFLTLSLQDIY